MPKFWVFLINDNACNLAALDESPVVLCLVGRRPRLEASQQVGLAGVWKHSHYLQGRIMEIIIMHSKSLFSHMAKLARILLKHHFNTKLDDDTTTFFIPTHKLTWGNSIYIH